MAQEVVWVEEAQLELDEIAAYIAQDSFDAAVDVVVRIRAAAIQLGDFPHMGPRVPEWDDDAYRQRILFSYRMIYRVTISQIEILAVWHGARLLPPSIRRRRPRLR